MLLSLRRVNRGREPEGFPALFLFQAACIFLLTDIDPISEGADIADSYGRMSHDWGAQTWEIPRERIVLLVEDNPEDAFLIEIELTRSPGCRLCIVADGQQALDYIAGKPPYHDRHEFPLPELILLDLKMPRLDGFEVLKWLRTHSQDEVAATPVIIISNSDSKQDVKEAYKLGANFYLTKPLDFGRFSERIRMLGMVWGEYAETLQQS
jgi:two-component system response regulator